MCLSLGKRVCFSKFLSMVASLSLSPLRPGARHTSTRGDLEAPPSTEGGSADFCRLRNRRAYLARENLSLHLPPFFFFPPLFFLKYFWEKNIRLEYASRVFNTLI